jgi:2-oxoisovalerate dehydrogenase E1 component
MIANQTPALHRLRRYAFMRLARDLDARFESLLLTGRVSKWYSEVGNEATTVPAGLALEPGDALCTLHRDLGAILAVYLDPEPAFPGFGFGSLASPWDGRRPPPVDLLHRLCCQLLGRGEGFSQGVERSFHYGHFDRRAGIVHVGMISHLGAMIPVAAGCAFAQRRRGRSRVAINFIGDGGTSTGDFHEALNMAAVWKLPLVLVIENNLYAFSTPISQQYAAERLSDRAVGYGIAGETVDGNDPDAMAAAIERAVERARAGERADADRGDARPDARPQRGGRFAQGGAAGGPRTLPRRRPGAGLPPPPARRRGADEETLARLEARVAELVEAGLEGALAAPPPAPEVADRPVFAPGGTPNGAVGEEAAVAGDAAPTSRRGLPPARSPAAPGAPAATARSPTSRRSTTRSPRSSSATLGGADGAGHRRLRRRLPRHPPPPRALARARARHPDRRERHRSASPSARRSSGERPVIEMQFSDFVSCGFNQIVNVAAKLYYRWQVPCPIVVRLPSGGGVGAGPFHSQNPEGWFAHVPGLKIVCPATAVDAKALLKAAIRDPNPVLFFEHKFLYRRVKEVMPDGDLVGEIGRAQGGASGARADARSATGCRPGPASRRRRRSPAEGDRGRGRSTCALSSPTTRRRCSTRCAAPAAPSSSTRTC